jgi:acylphosphatase
VARADTPPILPRFREAPKRVLPGGGGSQRRPRSLHTSLDTTHYCFCVMASPTSARIPRLLFASRSGMHETQFARRYYVSGMVQGVGYRYFARQLAQRLGIAGYVKNLRDGRVEVYVIGPASVLASLRTELERGPNGASVAGVTEEEAPVDPKFTARFTVERDSLS